MALQLDADLTGRHDVVTNWPVGRATFVGD